MTRRFVPSSRTLKILAGAGLLAFALALSMAAAGPLADGDAPARRPAADAAQPRLVETGGVTPSTTASTVGFAGTVRAVRRGALSFTVGGRLAERPVSVGQRVSAGAVLARLDRDELRHAVDAAEAAAAESAARAAQARRDLERVRRLTAAKAATAEELEQARSAAEVAAATAGNAAARLDEARRRLAEGVLSAPWDGTVTEVLMEPGEYAEAGAPVVRLSGDGALEVEVQLPESLLAAVSVGQEVAVEPTFGAAPRSGRVSSVGHAAAGPGHLYPVLVELPQTAQGSGLLPGAGAEVRFRRAPRGELSVPLAAVLNPGGSGAAVFAVRDGRAVRVPVRVGALDGARVAVLPTGGEDGGRLRSGERVVVAGHTGLIDGDPVRTEVSR